VAENYGSEVVIAIQVTISVNVGDPSTFTMVHIYGMGSDYDR